MFITAPVRLAVAPFLPVGQGARAGFTPTRCPSRPADAAPAVTGLGGPHGGAIFSVTAAGVRAGTAAVRGCPLQAALALGLS